MSALEAPTPAVIFAWGNQLALIGWIILIFFPRRFIPIVWIPHLLIPALLGLAYIALMMTNFTAAGGGFSSIGAVRTLMQNDAVLTAGWFHYLAFDLFVGAWIALRSDELGIARLIQAALLIATFMFGPTGLVLFLLIKTAIGKTTPHKVSKPTISGDA